MSHNSSENTILARVSSVNVGQAKAYVGPRGATTMSAIAKVSVGEKVRVPIVGVNLDGDIQVNRRYHGGPDKVVCAYCAVHFSRWHDEFGVRMEPGAFGENLTVATDADEDEFCIGDTLSVGSATLQISQPRQPCANVRRRWELPALPRRMEETGATGFYLRVVKTGDLGADDTIVLVDRPQPLWSVRRANAIMYGPHDNLAEIDALAELRELSAEWKRILGRKRQR